MPEVDLLNFKDIAENGPHTKHLVKAIYAKALNVGQDVKTIRDAMSTICLAQDQLSIAYKSLSDAFRTTTLGNPTINEPDDEFKQFGFQFCSFMDELTEIHHQFARDLNGGLLTQLNTYMGIFHDLSNEASALDNCDKASDQAFQNYMKLSKKSPYKLIHGALTELAMLRRDFERMASIHYGHLNEAGYLREIAPLLSVTAFLDSHTQHVKALNQVFGDTLATYLTAAQSGLKRRIEAEQDTALQFRSHVNNLDFEPLHKFCPEPWLLDTDLSGDVPPAQIPKPNTQLQSKSGRLLMRTRVGLLSRWIEVYCFTQSGNLMSQQYGELGASLLIDLNHKGVYAEVTDCDDRRHLFQIVSPTEHKTIILQAENEVERDEWIHTLTNVIYSVNRVADQASSSTVDGANSSTISSEVAPNINITTTGRSLKSEPATEWSASCLPPVRFELATSPQLNAVRDAELVCTHHPVLHESTHDPAQDGQTASATTTTASGSAPVVEDVIVVPEELPDPLEVAFLGAVELPNTFESMDPVKLNDLFSYVLSCRSVSTSPEPVPYAVLITKRDVWLLTVPDKAESAGETGDSPGARVPSTDVKRADVLVRVPFVQLCSWLIYPENPRLACLVVQGPLKDTSIFSEVSTRICFTFESDANQILAERLLAAQLERIDLLQGDENESERSALLSNIARLSEAATVSVSSSPTLVHSSVVRSSERSSVTNEVRGE